MPMLAEKLKSEVQSIATIKASTIEIIEEEGHEGKDLVCMPCVCSVGPNPASFVF